MIDKGFKFIDLFCGIGGFHQAMSSLGGECVFASDIEKDNQETYYDNYGIEVVGDITKVDAKDIPVHDVLCAGFPCFVADTLVMTHRGLIPIQDVVVGDKVLTHRGRYKRVLNTMYKETNVLQKIKTESTDYIYTTPNHPFYTIDDTWTNSKDLKIGSLVAIGKEDEITGAMDGFGCHLSGKHIKERTFNKDSSYQKILFFASFDEKCTLTKLSDNEYKVELVDNEKKDDSVIWTTVESNETITLNNAVPVYNLEVEDDNSYTADTLVVHNCQAFSIAGKRQGFEDPTKGTLFFDVVRIAKYHKPKYMLLENVKNLASHDNGNTWKVIYKTLNDIGYYVQRYPVIFSPHYLGIPQNRERVFIMCIRKEYDRIPDFIYEPDKNDLPICDINSILQDDSEILNLDDYKINKSTEELFEHWNKFVKHFKCDIPGCAIYAEYLNDSHLPEEDVPEYIKVYKKNCEEFYDRDKEFIDKWLEDGKTVEMFKNSRLHMEWQTNRSEDETIWNNLIQLRQSGIRVKRPTFFPTLVAIVQTSIIGPRKRYLTPRECARLQSFPDSFKINPKDSVAYHQFGNSVNVEVVKLFAKFMFGDEEIRKKYTVNQLF